ncbi:MAG: hypothetical protein WC682_03760 [Parcubacteria group bacterium]|jgi:hypothetical protein
MEIGYWHPVLKINSTQQEEFPMLKIKKRKSLPRHLSEYYEVVDSIKETIETIRFLEIQIIEHLIFQIKTKNELKLSSNIINARARKSKIGHYLKSYLDSIFESIQMEDTIRILNKNLTAFRFYLGIIQK